MAPLTWQRGPFWPLLIQSSTQGLGPETPSSDLKKKITEDFFLLFKLMKMKNKQANKKHIYLKIEHNLLWVNSQTPVVQNVSSPQAFLLYITIPLKNNPQNHSLLLCLKKISVNY